LATKKGNKMSVLGIMSGTSLDGLDLALCEFDENKGNYSFKITAAKTVEYNGTWKKRLSEVKDASAEAYFELNAQYGKYIAGEINVFLTAAQARPDAIASHGHTVFHQPKHGFSTQIGCGATIAANTGITTVCDFRSLDVAGGGQGAPLVPIGDKLLFAEYEACLNIGGIANISLDDKIGKRIAYDVCVANMALNYLAEKIGNSFDKDGALARSGEVIEELLKQLNNLSYYSEKGAKSIGREWFEEHVEKILEEKKYLVNDLLATYSEHISSIIAGDLNQQKIKNVFVTGGGTFNKFLIESVAAKTDCRLIIPKDAIVNFKEALIFAFLGYLRLSGKINTFSSVTGAKWDSVGGAVYLVR
jgi:anhydro-N-acetylmuramic acid kinase